MSDPSRIKGPQIFEGEVTFQEAVNLKSGCVENEHIGANAANPVDAEKLEKEFCVRRITDVDSVYAVFDEVVHIAQAAGEVVDLEIAVVTVPTGDNTLTVDVQKWDGASWTSILDSTEDVDSTYTANTPAVITLDGSPTYVDGDMIRFSGTLSGSSGAHGQGLIIQCRLREKP